MSRHLRASFAGALLLSALCVCLASSTGMARSVTNEPRLAQRLEVGAPGYRVTALTGSSEFLIFEKYRVRDGRRLNPGRLYALTSRGSQIYLGQITRRMAVDPIVRHTLVVQQSGTGKVAIWTLPGARAVHLQAPYGSDPIAAAPHGYLTVAQSFPAGPERLAQVNIAGQVTQLGSPFPHQATFQVTSGAHGYVAYVQRVEQAGGIRTGHYGAPHQFHTLLSASGRPGGSLCGQPTAQTVACRTAGSRRPLRLYRLDGGSIAATSRHCQAAFLPAPTTQGSTAYWIGCAHDPRLWQLGPGGAIEGSRATYARVTPVHALHSVIVTTHSRHALVALGRADGSPRVLVRVR